MRESQTRRTQEERREESEQRMLAAGVHLVAQHGTEKLTLTEVGKNAGYSRGLPAHHFGSRENYLKALASYIAIEFDKTLPEVNRISGLEAVLEIMRAVLDHLEADRTRGLATQIVLADPRRDRALSEDIAELRDNTLALLSRHIADGIKKGEIRATVMPDFASLFIAAGICGFIDSLLADAPFNIAAGGEQLLELIENALSAKPNRSSSP